MVGGDFPLPENLMPEMFQCQCMLICLNLINEFFKPLEKLSPGIPCLRGVI